MFLHTFSLYAEMCEQVLIIQNVLKLFHMEDGALIAQTGSKLVQTLFSLSFIFLHGSRVYIFKLSIPALLVDVLLVQYKHCSGLGLASHKSAQIIDDTMRRCRRQMGLQAHMGLYAFALKLFFFLRIKLLLHVLRREQYNKKNFT